MFHLSTCPSYYWNQLCYFVSSMWFRNKGHFFFFGYWVVQHATLLSSMHNQVHDFWSLLGLSLQQINNVFLTQFFFSLYKTEKYKKFNNWFGNVVNACSFRIYNLIIIIITRIWISIRYGFFKMSKVNHLTMFLPLIVLCMGSQWKHEKKHIENKHFLVLVHCTNKNWGWLMLQWNR
jgi:hypothetical protein